MKINPVTKVELSTQDIKSAVAAFLSMQTGKVITTDQVLYMHVHDAVVDVFISEAV